MRTGTQPLFDQLAAEAFQPIRIGSSDHDLASSFIGAGYPFDLYQACHGIFELLAGLARRGLPSHDPVVPAMPDPPARHVQPVRGQHEAHGLLGPFLPAMPTTA
jgi:hypothetical protein